MNGVLMMFAGYVCVICAQTALVLRLCLAKSLLHQFCQNSYRNGGAHYQYRPMQLNSTHPIVL